MQTQEDEPKEKGRFIVVKGPRPETATGHEFDDQVIQKDASPPPFTNNSQSSQTLVNE